MPTCATAFIEKSIALLTGDYLPKIAAGTLALGDEGLWWRANENSNSAGNLLLHLRGNVTQWIIGGVGGREYARQRDQEFAARSGASPQWPSRGFTPRAGPRRRSTRSGARHIPPN